jgi:hypothetical protein
MRDLKLPSQDYEAEPAPRLRWTLGEFDVWL